MGRALEGTITVTRATPIVSFAATGPLAEPGRPAAGANRGIGARISAVAARAAVVGLADSGGGIRGPAAETRRPMSATVAPGVAAAAGAGEGRRGDRRHPHAAGGN